MWPLLIPESLFSGKFQAGQGGAWRGAWLHSPCPEEPPLGYAAGREVLAWLQPLLPARELSLGLRSPRRAPSLHPSVVLLGGSGVVLLLGCCCRTAKAKAKGSAGVGGKVLCKDAEPHLSLILQPPCARDGTATWVAPYLPSWCCAHIQQPWEGGKGGGKGGGNCTPCAHHRQGPVFPFPLLHPSFPSTPCVPSRTLCRGCSLIPRGSEDSGGSFLQEPTFPGKHRPLHVPLPAPHWPCLSGVQGTDVPPAARLKPVHHSLAAPSSMLL